MNIGALLKTFIYLVSSVLLYPVLFLLTFLTLWTLYYSGGLVAEWLERRRLLPREPDELARELRKSFPERIFSRRVEDYYRRLRSLLNPVGTVAEPAVERMLAEEVARYSKSLDIIRMLVRIAPGAGLIGTLIPMGTGLAALSGKGGMEKMLSDLVVAFTTTVVGLAIGMTAYFLYTIRRRWVEQDIRAIEFITEILAGSAYQEEENEVHETQETS